MAGTVAWRVGQGLYGAGDLRRGRSRSRMSQFLDLDIKPEVDAVRIACNGIPTRSFQGALKALNIPASFVGAESTIRPRLQSPLAG